MRAPMDSPLTPAVAMFEDWGIHARHWPLPRPTAVGDVDIDVRMLPELSPSVSDGLKFVLLPDASEESTSQLFCPCELTPYCRFWTARTPWPLKLQPAEFFVQTPLEQLELELQLWPVS